MQKIIKISGIVIGVVLLFCIGRCVYMVACISCTTPSIKTYNFAGSMDQLENNFKNFAIANSNIQCEISRRGTDPFDARDVKIKIKNWDINCNLVIHDFNNNTKLDIREIYDYTYKKGGNDANDKNVKELLNKFEKTFLVQLQKDQGIQLKTPFFNLF